MPELFFFFFFFGFCLLFLPIIHKKKTVAICRFVWGQSRLPQHSADFQTKFEITPCRNNSDAGMEVVLMLSVFSVIVFLAWCGMGPQSGVGYRECGKSLSSS